MKLLLSTVLNLASCVPAAETKVDTLPAGELMMLRVDYHEDYTAALERQSIDDYSYETQLMKSKRWMASRILEKAKAYHEEHFAELEDPDGDLEEKAILKAIILMLKHPNLGEHMHQNIMWVHNQETKSFAELEDLGAALYEDISCRTDIYRITKDMAPESTHYNCMDASLVTSGTDI